MFFLRLSLKGLRRNWPTQAFSLAAATLILTLLGALFGLDRALGPVIERLSSSGVLTVFVNGQLSDSAFQALGADIQGFVERRSSEVDRIEFVGSGDFLARLKQETPGLANELLNLGPEMPKMIPRFVSVSGRFSPDVVESIKGMTGVESVTSSAHELRPLASSLATLRRVVRILMGGLGLAWVVLFFQLAHMNSVVQADIQRVLSQWGAGFWTSRSSVLFATSLAGFTASFLSACALYGVSGLFSSLARAAAPLGLETWLRSLHGLGSIDLLLVTGTGFILSLVACTLSGLKFRNV